MFRLFNVYHPRRTFLLVGSEVLLIVLSFVAAIKLSWSAQSYSILFQPAGLVQLFLTTGTYMLCLYYFDSYDIRSIIDRSELLWRLFCVLGVAALALGAVEYLFPSLIVVRNVYVLGILISLVLLLAGRMVFARLVPNHPKNMILIGLSELGCELARETRRRPDLGIKVLGFIDDGQELGFPHPALPCLGAISEIEQIITAGPVDLLVVALRDRRGRLPVKELLRPRMLGMSIVDVGTLCEQISGKIPFENVFPSWLIFSEGFHLHRRLIILQRIYSCIFSALGVLISLPVMVLVAIAIKLESRGPILYSQDRVGLEGRTFSLYKFRSMRQDAEQSSGPTWAVDKDQRITRVGRFLRASRLDELPQLWNVLRGDMNLVGPRPERPSFVKTLEAASPYYAYRHLIRPGITGWHQVCQGYCSTVEEQMEKLRYDLFYIKNISLSLDLYILFKTGRIIVWGRGAK